LSVCAACDRENEPAGDRCPACGAPRPGSAQQPDGSPDVHPAQGSYPRSGPRLILKGAAGEVTEYPLGDSNVLGRSTTADVRLTDREVSRKHSQIDLAGDKFVLSDLGSSNGTFLNGERILEPTPLEEGDEVMIGTSKMEFRLTRGGLRPKNAEIVHTGAPERGRGGADGRQGDSVPAQADPDVTQPARIRAPARRPRILHLRPARAGTRTSLVVSSRSPRPNPCDNGVVLLRDQAPADPVIQAMRQRVPGVGAGSTRCSPRQLTVACSLDAIATLSSFALDHRIGRAAPRCRCSAFGRRGEGIAPIPAKDRAFQQP
jgi:hypothetical protein